MFTQPHSGRKDSFTDGFNLAKPMGIIVFNGIKINKNGVAHLQAIDSGRERSLQSKSLRTKLVALRASQEEAHREVPSSTNLVDLKLSKILDMKNPVDEIYGEGVLNEVAAKKIIEMILKLGKEKTTLAVMGDKLQMTLNASIEKKAVVPKQKKLCISGCS